MVDCDVDEYFRSYFYGDSINLVGSDVLCCSIDDDINGYVNWSWDGED